MKILASYMINNRASWHPLILNVSLYSLVVYAAIPDFSPLDSESDFVGEIARILDSLNAYKYPIYLVIAVMIASINRYVVSRNNPKDSIVLAIFTLTTVSTILAIFMLFVSSIMILQIYDFTSLLCYDSVIFLFGMGVAAFFCRFSNDNVFDGNTSLSRIYNSGSLRSSFFEKKNWIFLFIAATIICPWFGMFYSSLGAPFPIYLLCITVFTAISVLLQFSYRHADSSNIRFLAWLPSCAGLASFILVFDSFLILCVAFLVLSPPMTIILIALVVVPSVLNFKLFKCTNLLVFFVFCIAFFITFGIIALAYKLCENLIHAAFEEYLKNIRPSEKEKLAKFLKKLFPRKISRL